MGPSICGRKSSQDFSPRINSSRASAAASALVYARTVDDGKGTVRGPYEAVKYTSVPVCKSSYDCALRIDAVGADEVIWIYIGRIERDERVIGRPQETAVARRLLARRVNPRDLPRGIDAAWKRLRI